MNLSTRQRKRLLLQAHVLFQAVRPGVRHVIDFGVERGLGGMQLRSLFPEAELIGVEVQPQWIELGMVYDRILGMDALECLSHMDDQEADVALAAELIEHMEKPEGRMLLSELRRSSKFSVVTTPLGLMPQGEFGDNPHQRHLSGWIPREFEDEGWEVYHVDFENSLIVAYR